MHTDSHGLSVIHGAELADAFREEHSRERRDLYTTLREYLAARDPREDGCGRLSADTGV